MEGGIGPVIFNASLFGVIFCFFFCICLVQDWRSYFFAQRGFILLKMSFEASCCRDIPLLPPLLSLVSAVPLPVVLLLLPLKFLLILVFFPLLVFELLYLDSCKIFEKFKYD